MAATTASSHQLHKNPTARRRLYKETTISSSAAGATTAIIHNRRHHPSVVSPENNSWCCPSTVSSSKPPHAPPPTANTNPEQPTSNSTEISPSPESFSSEFKLEKARSLRKMTTTSTVYGGPGNHPETYVPSFTEFNSALTAGLLNPMSPPPPPPIADKTRSSPTLFEMMVNEPEKIPINSIPKRPNANSNFVMQPPLIIDRQALMQQRLSDLLSCRSPGNQFNDPISSDVKLTLSSKDGLSVSMNVHKQILVAHSRFFAAKLSDNRWKGGQPQKGLIDNNNNNNKPYIVEISDCDDIEVYIESIRLMYCKDLRKKLMKDDVPKVLGILKVSAAIGFDAGVLSCLEYLEAAPWAEEEEEKISSLLSELRLEEGVAAIDVLKRVSIDEANDKEEVIFKLLHVVLEGKNEKSRREMKTLVSKMLRENSSQTDLSKESLYSACEKCLYSLRNHFLKASKGDLQDLSQITRECDNLYWLLDILIDRQIGDDFLKLWASQKELANVHSKVSAIHRHEISKVTARLFVGIGKGQLLTSKDSRCLLLETWLVPFYDDFAWMRRASKGLDRHLIEEALSNTILTLPLTCQQEIMVSWFDRFLNSGEDCPNLQTGFEVWWRRAFCRRKGQIRHVNTQNS